MQRSIHRRSATTYAPQALKTVWAKELRQLQGIARDVQFLDAKTALVCNRDCGTIYQLKLP